MSIDIRNLTITDISRMCGLITKVTCPGGCNEQLDPAYITNTVVIDGDTTKVCDRCFDNYEECDKCHLYHHTDWNNKVYVSHDHGCRITCNDCADAICGGYEEAMERKGDESRLEGRRFA